MVALLAVFAAWHAGKHAGSSQQERLETNLSQADARLNALEARRLIHHSILELEARNFGSAQGLAQEAARFLAGAADGAVDPPSLETTLTRLREFQTRVDPDVGKQIATLVAVSRTIDEQFPVPARPHGLEEPAEGEGAPPVGGEPAAIEPAPQNR